MIVTMEEEAELFAKLCDAISRIYFAERWNLDPNDGQRHTSSGVRYYAGLVHAAMFDHGDLENYREPEPDPIIDDDAWLAT